MPKAVLWQWVRHHATSVLSTIVDYSVMVTCVELGKLSPVLATVAGAACGAITNFTVNRSFTYQAGGQAVHRQAWRFVLVSAASLGLNAGGMYLFTKVLDAKYYVLARMIISVIVSNVWNYPMLRFFVFSGNQPPSRA